MPSEHESLREQLAKALGYIKANNGTYLESFSNEYMEDLDIVDISLDEAYEMGVSDGLDSQLDNKSNEESTMNGTKSIEQVIGELESIAERMKASDFRGILEHNDRGLHDAAFTSVETAVLLLRLAKEDEDVQA